MSKVLGRQLLLSSAIAALLGCNAVWAQNLALSDLPNGCSYTRSEQQPLNGLVKIPAATPLFAAIGDAPHTLLDIGVQCDGPITTPVSLGLKESGALDWIGPGRDVLTTNVNGIGVRLFADAYSEGSRCIGSGAISAGKSASCSITSEGTGTRRVGLSLKAQLVKISNNTPIQLQRSLQLTNGGALLLESNGATQQQMDVLNSGLLAPSIATEASCTLVTEQNRTVNFGTIYRPKSGDQEATLGQAQVTPIEVSCSPLRDNTANNYNVSITFQAAQLLNNDTSALATSIDDMAIRFSTNAQGGDWQKFGEKLPMPYNAAISGDTSHFAQTWYWFLRYLPGENHQQTGNIDAIATYTITIE
ncbi:fimbrial protein (plasmid) [Pantoea dispersa]|uniref:fimbrial protein n=1 Tax=Pantoea dispersa TaxID=59814 RepID=UPI001CA715B8|nr:fimbrial protein [Pantoea dispersa]QZY92936.1 fimbrial protein [Pantoea dispersa]